MLLPLLLIGVVILVLVVVVIVVVLVIVVVVVVVVVIVFPTMLNTPRFQECGTLVKLGCVTYTDTNYGSARCVVS
jgi:hypothetical protein